jgi:hypothetical protein
MEVNVVSSPTVQIEIAGANVTLSAKAIADLWIERLTRKSAVSGLPRIGAAWPGQGGTYVGLARGRDGAPDYALIVAERFTSAQWARACEWATEIVVDGHSDFTLPTRTELHLMIANAKELFKPEWHWSSEQYAPNGDSAWAQSFGGGFQGDSRKDNEFLARAVRRVPL